jgi:hypothetical protein
MQIVLAKDDVHLKTRDSVALGTSEFSALPALDAAL